MIFLAFFLGLWELSAKFYMEHRFILPAPSQVLFRLLENPGRFWYHTEITFWEMLGGMTLAFIFALPLAWLMDRFKQANLLLQPLCILIQCIPMFTLAPLMILWFGWSSAAIIFSTMLMIFFPLLMNIYKGLTTVPSYLKSYFRIHQATTWQTFIKLQLPWIKPYVFSGLRISTAIAGTGAIAGEWAGAQAGLGVLMQESRRATDLSTTFGALFCLAILSVGFYLLILLIERALTKESLRSSWLSLFIFVLIGAGCNSSDPSPKVKVLLDWLPNPNHVPLYVGISQNIFCEQGIELEILKLQDPSDSVPYIVSQQADLALYYMPQMLRANKNGAGLTPVAVLIDRPLNCLLFKTSHPINNIEDLRHKTIGYCIDGTETSELDRILKMNGLTPADVMKKNVSFDFVSALGTGQVDVVFGAFWNIEGAHLKSLGIDTDYLSLISLGYPDYDELIFMTSLTSPINNSNFIDKFQKALAACIDFCLQNPEKAFELYALSQKDKSQQTLVWEKEAWLKTLPALALDVAPNIKKMSDYLEKTK